MEFMEEEGSGSEETNFFTTTFAMKLHGLLMLLAWGYFANLTIWFARYMKFTDQWFRYHLISVGLVVLLSLLGFILILCHIGFSGGEHFEGVHHVVGLIVLCLTAIQIALGLVSHLTWHEGKAISPIDKWHWIVGRATFLTSLVAILLGFNQLGQEENQVGVFTWIFLGLFYLLGFLCFAAFEIYLFPARSAHLSTDEKFFPLENEGETRTESRNLGTVNHFFFVAFILGISVSVLAICLFFDVFHESLF